MPVYIQACAPCRAKRREQRASVNTASRPRFKRKQCDRCKFIAVLPVKFGRRSVGVFSTKGDAEVALDAAVVDARRGKLPPPAKLAVRDVVEKYLADPRLKRDPSTKLSVTTVHRMRELWRLYGQNIASLKVADFKDTKRAIGALYDELRTGLAGRTILHLHRMLHRAFQWALEDEIIAVNVFASVKSPTAESSEARALSQDEAARFFAKAREIEFAGMRFEDFYLLAALTGARRGELAALKWTAVDFDGKVLTIREALASTRASKDERANGAVAIVTKAPKSGRSRVVPLDDDALAVLRRISSRQAADKLRHRVSGSYYESGLVFTDEYGQPIPLDYYTKAFRAVANAAQLPQELSLHSLRHTFASWSLGNGTDLTAVQQILGHSVPSTTLNIYSHAIAGSREKAVQGVAAALRTARTAEASK